MVSMNTSTNIKIGTHCVHVGSAVHAVTGHFSVKVDFTWFRKYRSLCNCQVNHVGVEHLLFFRIRNELQFVKVQKVIICLEFPPIC